MIMAENKSKSGASSENTPMGAKDNSDSGAPALHLNPKIPNVALADAEQRSIPVTHPDSDVVGADGFNRAVTRQPEPLVKPVSE
jgi:hypothetical protein